MILLTVVGCSREGGRRGRRRTCRRQGASSSGRWFGWFHPPERIINTRGGEKGEGRGEGRGERGEGRGERGEGRGGTYQGEGDQGVVSDDECNVEEGGRGVDVEWAGEVGRCVAGDDVASSLIGVWYHNEISLQRNY